MKVTPLAIPDVLLIEPKVFGDHRGFFMETWNQRAFTAAGIDRAWVQDNCSRSARGVLRGLHYQIGRAQAKLVRCGLGEVFDVAVDIRRGSPTFGRWVGERLSADNKRALFVPEGFAHGFLVLSEIAEFSYKCSDFYTPSDERGVRWDDPGVAIAWPDVGETPTLSARDAVFAQLKDVPVADLPAYRRAPGSA
ncbi:MAG TPA: dTDP-4-dehydrorhamnose 3,5-epimerase [Planctomycetota bacterium]|nr:dTDP-4-dehydrorhamnose 3,5-epimerase [Planctomycetota bacterium]